MIIRYGKVDPNGLEYTLAGIHTSDYLARNRWHMEKWGIINPILVMSIEARPPYVTSGVTRTHCAKLLEIELMAIIYARLAYE